MKEHFSLFLILCVSIYLFSGCTSPQTTDETTEIIVFAAASLSETLTELGDSYMADHSDVNIIFNFESSGTLKTQIQEGAACDLFLSAGQKQMDQLDITADPAINTEQLDFICPDSRLDLLENTVVLAVPAGNPAGLHSFEDLKTALEKHTVLLAIGNADVPVGQYSQQILSWFGIDAQKLAEAGCITYGANAKELTTQISESTVDCGIIYATDAFSAGLTVVDTAATKMCGQVIYPAAVLKTASQPEAAQEFLNFLTTPQADSVFTKVGFTPLA